MGRGGIVLAAALIVLTGCGSDDSGGSVGPTDPQTVVVTEMATPTPAAPEMTLKEICPQVEAALPGGMIPTAPKLQAFISSLQTQLEQGDVEAQNAIPLLFGPTQDLYAVIAAGGQGSDLTDALGPYIDGISAFANRCKAAGSSALQ